MKTLLQTLILFSVLSFTAFAQQSARERGLEFYKQAKYSEAIQIFQTLVKQDKQDAEIWNALGLSYLNVIELKKSRKALATAVKINPQNSNYRTNLAFVHLVSNKIKQAAAEIETALRLNAENAEAYYIRGNIHVRQGNFANATTDAERALTIKPQFAPAYLLKAESYLYSFGDEVSKGIKPADKAEMLKMAMETLEICLTKCDKSYNLQTHQEMATALKIFYGYFNRSKEESLNQLADAPVTVVAPSIDPSITLIKILTKPRANYTDSARAANIKGIVRLAVLFSAEGRVKYILVLKPLSNGLTEEAIKAARLISFEPQKKDGKPVSVVRIVEYSFTLY